MGSILVAIAKNLKSRRKFLGISQAQLAERAGISVGYIGEIEIARKYPSLETIELLAAALETRPYCLLMTDEDVATASITAGKDQAWAMIERFREHLDVEVREYIRPGGS